MIDPLAFAMPVAFALLGAALLITFVRLALGPTLADRVVALDLMAALVLGGIAVYTVAAGEVILLRVAIALALLAFVTTVAFAHYLEKRGTQ